MLIYWRWGVHDRWWNFILTGSIHSWSIDDFILFLFLNLFSCRHSRHDGFLLFFLLLFTFLADIVEEALLLYLLYFCPLQIFNNTAFWDEKFLCCSLLHLQRGMVVAATWVWLVTYWLGFMFRLGLSIRLRFNSGEMFSMFELTMSGRSDRPSWICFWHSFIHCTYLCFFGSISQLDPHGTSNLRRLYIFLQKTLVLILHSNLIPFCLC